MICRKCTVDSGYCFYPWSHCVCTPDHNIDCICGLGHSPNNNCWPDPLDGSAPLKSHGKPLEVGANYQAHIYRWRSLELTYPKASSQEAIGALVLSTHRLLLSRWKASSVDSKIDLLWPWLLLMSDVAQRRWRAACSTELILGLSRNQMRLKTWDITWARCMLLVIHHLLLRHTHPAGAGR